MFLLSRNGRPISNLYFKLHLCCMWENFGGVLLKYWRINQLEGKGFYKGIIGGQIGKQLSIHRICQFFPVQNVPTYGINLTAKVSIDCDKICSFVSFCIVDLLYFLSSLLLYVLQVITRWSTVVEIMR